MAFTITFTPTGMSAPKYDEVMRQLDAAGAGAPKGRLFHTCYGPENALRVVDVWASMEDFQAFGATLIPILQSLGVDVGQPDVQPQRNSVTGS